MIANRELSTGIPLSILTLLILFNLWSCEEKPTEYLYPDITREDAIPDSSVKMTPETDPFPPVLHLDEWENPVPLAGDINTAGAEDSPFIPIDRD